MTSSLAVRISIARYLAHIYRISIHLSIYSIYQSAYCCKQYCLQVCVSFFADICTAQIIRKRISHRPRKSPSSKTHTASSTVQSGIVGWRIEGAAVMWRRRPGGGYRSDTVDDADRWTSWRWASMRLAQVHRTNVALSAEKPRQASVKLVCAANHAQEHRRSQGCSGCTCTPTAMKKIKA